MSGFKGMRWGAGELAEKHRRWCFEQIQRGRPAGLALRRQIERRQERTCGAASGLAVRIVPHPPTQQRGA